MLEWMIAHSDLLDLLGTLLLAGLLLWIVLDVRRLARRLAGGKDAADDDENEDGP